MHYCPLSLEKIQKDTCSFVHLSVLVAGHCSVSAGSTWGSNNEVVPCSGSQIPALSQFTLLPTKAFGEAILLLFKEGYPVLSWAHIMRLNLFFEKEKGNMVHCSKRWLTLSLVKLLKRTWWSTEPGGCFLLNLWGSTGERLSHRALSLPRDLRHTATTECFTRNKNNCDSTSHAKLWMSCPFSSFLACFGLEPTLNSLWKENTSD